MKKIGIMLLLVFLISISTVWAIDGLRVSCWPGSNNDYIVEAGTRIYSDISLISNKNLENVQVYSRLGGDVKTTQVFDMRANAKYKEYFYFDLPSDMSGKYMLRYSVSNEHSSASECVSNLIVDKQRHTIEIKDITLAPGNTVQAGKMLQVQSLLQNHGQKDEKLVKVTVTSTDLGFSESKFFNHLASGKSEVTDMTFQIPSCSEPGKYILNFKVMYDEGDVTINKQVPIEITAGTTNCGTNNIQKVEITGLKGTTDELIAAYAQSGNAPTTVQLAYFQQLSVAQKEQLVAVYAKSGNVPTSEQLAYLQQLPASEREQLVSAYVAQKMPNLSIYLGVGLLVLLVILVIIGLIFAMRKLKK